MLDAPASVALLDLETLRTVVSLLLVLRRPVIDSHCHLAGPEFAAAIQLADPSTAGPLLPLYLRRPDAKPQAVPR